MRANILMIHRQKKLPFIKMLLGIRFLCIVRMIMPFPQMLMQPWYAVNIVRIMRHNFFEYGMYFLDRLPCFFAASACFLAEA